ncbi:MAG: alpha/beta hydrolase [Planctomycetes bacterium]|nr:alpha/beta hydrolase [Planctomycetota bacterium]
MAHPVRGSLLLSLALWLAGQAAADDARLYPEKSFTLEDGMRIVYVDSGDGFPIVFVHGLLADHRQWYHNFPYFDGRYRVIGIDLPGHGGSAKVEGYDYSVPNLSRALVALLDHLGVAKAVLVGNSLGGHVSLYTALAYSDRVERLVLVDPAGVRLGEMEHAVISLAERIDPLRLYPGATVGQFLARAVIARNLSSPIVDAYTRDLETLATDDAARRLTQEVFVSCLHSVEKDHLSGRLGEIGAKTLIVWGARDFIIRPKYARELHRQIPNSELEIFEHTGHVPSVEKPEAFNGRVERFLEGLPETTTAGGVPQTAGR